MDLLSIAAPAVPVPVGTGPNDVVQVRGLSLRAIASLMARFPDLLELFNGRDINIQVLLHAAPEAAAAIMAAACGYPNDPAAERIADGLPLEYQTGMLVKAVELTFPGGLGPFVDRVSLLASSIPTQRTTEQTNGADHAPPATS